MVKSHEIRFAFRVSVPQNIGKPYLNADGTFGAPPLGERPDDGYRVARIFLGDDARYRTGRDAPCVEFSGDRLLLTLNTMRDLLAVMEEAAKDCPDCGDKQ